MRIILADHQEVTQFAIIQLLQEVGCRAYEVEKVGSIAAIKSALHDWSDVKAVVLDYTTLNTSEEELLLLHLRYPQVQFLLFSDQLSRDLLRRMLLGSSQFSVVLKDSPLHEIQEALAMTVRGRQYICTDVQQLIDAPEKEEPSRSPLSKTEKDILRLLAMGKTSKDIAAERYLSVYTVMTHRKNIFRKLQVNNAQEAIRYALRAGIVDPLEYYI